MIDASKLKRLQRKGFRDAFVRSHLAHGLAYQVRALREQRGWTQAQLAAKLGLKGQSAIARLEDPSYGRLSIATLLKLSSVFDVALSVHFRSFGKFLEEIDDLTPAALTAVGFEAEIPNLLVQAEPPQVVTRLPYAIATSVDSNSPSYIKQGGIGNSQYAFSKN